MEYVVYLKQVLYFLVYSISIVSISVCLIFRKRAADKDSGKIRFFVISAAIYGALVSVNVFAAASGLYNFLPGYYSILAILIMNILSVAGAFTVLVSASKAAFVFNPSAYSRKISSVVLMVSSVLFLATLILQVSVVVFSSRIAVPVLSVVQNISVVFLVAVLAACIFMAVSSKGVEAERAGKTGLIMMLLWIIIMQLVIMFIHSDSGILAVPAGFIVLNLLGFYLMAKRLIRVDEETTESETVLINLGLSQREAEVAVLLAEGLSYKNIADRLFVSVSTIQTHVGRIYSKLRINNKTELANLLGKRRRD